MVVPDGMENTGQSSLEQVIAQARRMGLLVYSIGIGDPNSGTLPGLAIGPFIFGADPAQLDPRTLNMPSTETGAKTFLVLLRRAPWPSFPASSDLPLYFTVQ